MRRSFCSMLLWIDLERHVSDCLPGALTTGGSPLLGSLGILPLRLSRARLFAGGFGTRFSPAGRRRRGWLGPNRWFVRGGFFVDDLSGLLELSFDARFSSLHGLLAQVNGIRQDLASLLNGARVGPFLKFDPFGFQELADMTVKFVFIDLIHTAFMPDFTGGSNYMSSGTL
jgi:hypothetical protein